MPYSFAMYFPVRWLEHVWKRGHTRLVKALWYAVLGLMYLFGAVGAGTVAMYICFIEAWDLVFDHLEARRRVRLNEGRER